LKPCIANAFGSFLEKNNNMVIRLRDQTKCLVPLWPLFFKVFNDIEKLKAIIRHIPNTMVLSV
jgi:hypothetical protein